MKIRNVLVATALAAAAMVTGTAGPAAASVSTQATGIGTYTVTVRTGNLAGAGTDATVKLTVFGTLGTSPTTNLDNGDDNFEAAKTDVFGAFNWYGIGDVGYIALSKRGGSDWFPEYVDIYEQSESAQYHCTINEWIKGNVTKYYGCNRVL